MRPDLEARIQATNKPVRYYAEVIDDKTAEQFADCIGQPSVIQGALMPDTHAGYVAPIGSVLLTEGTIFPSFVGYDIGCGMCEAKLDIKTSELNMHQLEQVKEEILKRVPIGFNRHKKNQPLTRDLRDMPMADFAKQVLKEQGGTQIGTLGGGNHFLEMGETNDGYLSIVIHSGSRGVGHKIATNHMKLAAIANTDKQRYAVDFDTKNANWKAKLMTTKPSKQLDQMQDKYDKAKEEFIYRRVRARVDNIEDAYALDVTSKEGKDYINDMNMCLQFALDNRKMMIDTKNEYLHLFQDSVYLYLLLSYVFYVQYFYHCIQKYHRNIVCQ